MGLLNWNGFIFQEAHIRDRLN